MQSTVAVPEQYLGLSFTERKDGNVYLFLRERMEKTFLVVLKRLAASQQSCTVPGRDNIWMNQMKNTMHHCTMYTVSTV